MNFNNIKNVAVLCGGDGREREVSLRSGEAVCKALNEAGFNAQTLDLHSMDEIDRVKDFDAAFIAMHGDWGEGGQLQAELDKLGIHYTGSRPEASALAMDKWKALELFKQSGIQAPESLLMPVSYDGIIEQLGHDVVVKPCGGGSTVGVTIIKDLTPEKLSQAVKLAQTSYLSDVMVERYIPGRELTCAVWEHEGKTEALPVIEIVPHAGFYDYKNKYTAGATEYITPAKIDEAIRVQVSEMAVKAHKVLGCRAYSRSDFRLDPDNKVYILEVNTAPGMTATSLVPKAARAIGVELPEFVTHILRCE
ncbi:MAG: D-alanine--D-alanine ligase [Synergistaceae bacterium]|nr:D-alanine--D-alanine ligase [Synergistaceae bacterium]MBR0203116.1 D-alanine--D-alanine ligase [Synergistaceae bacterium]